MNIYSNDWFNRSEQYTYKNTDLSIGWDAEYRKKNIFSTYMYSPEEIRRILANDNALKHELMFFVDAINLQNIRLALTNDVDTGMTTGKDIIIGKKFSFDFENDFDIMDIYIGMMLHECCHCKWTDFNIAKSYQKNDDNNAIIHNIHNIIEDEMIERQLGLLYPGYINFISKVKYKFFNENIFENKNAFKNSFDEIMGIFFYIVRYPKYINTIDAELLGKYESLFEQVHDIFKKYNVFDLNNKSITNSSYKSAVDIYNLFKDYIDNKDNNQDDNESSDSQDGNESGDSQNNGGDNQNNGGDTQNESGDSQDSDKHSNNSEGEKQAQEIIEDEESVFSRVVKILNAISSASEQGANVKDCKILKVEVNAYNDTVNNICDKKEKKEERDREDNITVTKCTSVYDEKFAEYSDVISYNEMYKTIKPYISYVNNIMYTNKTYTEKTVSQRYVRSGHLDPSRLANAYQNELNVYYRNHTVRKEDINKFAVVIMLDESGSMGCSFSRGYNSCDYIASQLSILFYEAFSKNKNIELYIYGHGDSVITYIDKKHKNKYVLGSRVLQYNQNEQISYTKIIKYVRQQTKLPIIAINITDSMYGCYPSVIKEVINEYANDNVSFNLISLEPNAESEKDNIEIYGINNYFEMNADSDLSNLKKLAGIIAKNINSKIRKK